MKNKFKMTSKLDTSLTEAIHRTNKIKIARKHKITKQTEYVINQSISYQGNQNRMYCDLVLYKYIRETISQQINQKHNAK